MVLCVLAGIGVGAAHVLPWAMIPDAIEIDELKTGERHEGMFYSLVTLMGKVANSIAVPLALAVLDLSGYIPNAVAQPKSTLTGIRWWLDPSRRYFFWLGSSSPSSIPFQEMSTTRLCTNWKPAGAKRKLRCP